MGTNFDTWVNGIYMPERYKNYENIVYDWNVRNEDVWICTFPKSGTTWIQEMVWLIMNGLDYEKAKIDLDIRIPFFEITAIHEMILRPTSEDEVNIYENSFEYVKKMTKDKPICIKTHLPWNLLPKDIQESRKKPKIIYVCRNAKAVAVSLHHHQIFFHNYETTLEDSCLSFLEGKVPWGPYWKHIIPFWQKRNQSNIFFLTYEEMAKDLSEVIRRVAKFLGKQLTEAQIATLSDYLSFSKMKGNKAVAKELFLRYFHDTANSSKTFIRCGKADGYKKEMSEDFIKKFDDWIKENTDSVGCDIEELLKHFS